MTDYPDFVSQTIKKLGFWDYSHVSISTDSLMPTFYSFVGKHGFREEVLIEHPTFRGKDIPCVLFRLPVDQKELDNIEKEIKHFVENKHEYKYSYIGLMLLYLRIAIASKKRFTCTGFVLRTIRKHTDLIKKNSWYICNPNDINKHFSKQKIFEGTIKSMIELMNNGTIKL